MMSLTSYSNTKLDTLYYDKDWKGVSNKAFASFYRVIDSNNDNGFKKNFRDYYITGELQAEGGYVSIDKYDDSKSVFTGEWCTYYKSGKTERKGFRNDGIDEGDFYEYYENGLVKFHANFNKGELNGIATTFSEDGSACRQDEYDNGNLKYDYYIVSNKDGYISKYKISDNTPIMEIPTEADKKVEYKDGVAWPYYVKNGLVVAMSNNQVKDYGKYYQIYITIGNYSMQPIDFDPNETTSAIFNKKGEKIQLKVFSCEEYMKKVNRKQSWNKFWMELGEGLAAYGAGRSTSTTNTNTNYNMHSNTYGTASAYGSGGYAYGRYSGHSNHSGNINTTSTTVTYDGAAAYQARVMASERLAAYEDKQLAIKNAKEQGYLKKTTIYPGETISGYINIQRQPGLEMYVNLYINKIPYHFTWNVGK